MLQRFVLLVILALIPSCSCSQGRFSVGDSSITGILQTVEGRPLRGMIFIFSFVAAEGRFQPDLSCGAATENDGSFECRHLASGRYLVIASSFHRDIKSGQKRPQSVTEEDLPLFAIYPTNTDLNPLNFIALSKGEARSISLSVPTGKELSELHVISAAGDAKGKSLQLALDGADFSVPLPLALRPATAAGNYVLRGLPAVPYELTENWTVDRVVRQAVVQSEQVEGQVTVAISRSYTVTGMVQFLTQLPTAPTEVFLISARGEELIRYVAPTSKDGSLTFKNVDAGRYYVAFNPGDGLRIVRISIGGKELDGTIITVGEGSASLSISLAAEYAPATVIGLLKLNGTEPRPGIVMHSDDAHTDRVIRVNAQGSFRVDNVAAGHYQIFGWGDITNVPYENSHFVRRYADKALNLDLEPAATMTDLSVECIAATP